MAGSAQLKNGNQNSFKNKTLGSTWDADLWLKPIIHNTVCGVIWCEVIHIMNWESWKDICLLEGHLFTPEGHLFMICSCIMFDLYYAHVYKFSSAHAFIFTKCFSLMSLWGTTEYNEWLHEQGSAYEDMMTTIN